MNKRAALYIRVSTEEQKKHGLSVENQREALEEYARQQGYIVAGVYNDAGISAAKSYKKRPELLRMIDDCKAKKIDIVLFTRLDRFFRSVPDYYACIEKMDGTPWRAIWEDYETETSAGVFKVNIMLSIAQAEASRTSEKIKSVMEYKREKGDYLGQVPYGYKRDGKTIAIDEEQEPAIRALFAAFLNSFSTTLATKAANEKGLNFGTRTARRILESPTYKGEAPGGVKVPAYISEEDFEKIQEAYRKRSRVNEKTGRIFLFSGLLFCNYCGHRLGSTVTAAPVKKQYKCRDISHRNLSIAERKLEKHLLETIDERISCYIEESKTKSSPKDQKIIAKKKAALEAKLSRLVNLYEEGDLSLEDYKQKRDAAKAELASLSFDDKKIEALNLPENWIAIYNQLDDAHRRAFWLRIIKEIRIDNENKKEPTVLFY